MTLFYSNKIEKAIEVFELVILQDPDTANLYDSLGEVFFKAKDFKNAKKNFRKSLELNPGNDNAKKYIAKINQLINE